MSITEDTRSQLGEWDAEEGGQGSGRRRKWAKGEAEKKSVTIWGEGEESNRRRSSDGEWPITPAKPQSEQRCSAVTIRGRTRGSELRGPRSAP